MFLRKTIILGLLLTFFISFSCKLNLTEINPSLDVFEVGNFDSQICSGLLIFTGNLRSKDTYSTVRQIDNFVLSGYTVALIANDCEDFSGVLCYSFDKTFRVFNDVDLKYSIKLDNIYQTGYYFSSGLLDKDDGSLSLVFSGNRYIWIWTGENLGKFIFVNSGLAEDLVETEDTTCEDNVKQIYRRCYITQDNLSGNMYMLSITGNFLTGVYRWFLDGQYIDSGQKLSISVQTGNHLIEAQIFSGDELICKSYFSISNTVRYLTSYIETNIYTGYLKIEEIHPFDDDLPEYIELKAIGNWSGLVEIAGLGRGDSVKSFYLTLYSGQSIVITDKLESFSGYDVSNILKVDSISLTDGGEKLIVKDSSGKVMDQIYYSGAERGKSLYFDFLSGDIRVFDKLDIPTPGVSIEAIKHYIESSLGTGIVDFYIKLQNSSPFYFGNSVNFIAVFSGREISNSDDSYECGRYLDNQLIFTGCNPYYIKFDKSGILPIKLVLKNKIDGNVYQTMYYLNYPEKPSCNCSCGSCKQEYYFNLYKKWKNKYYDLKKQINLTKKISDKDGYVYLTGLLKIDYILPNPKGKDKGNEQIAIRVLQDVNLGGKFIKIGKKKYYLSGIWQSGDVINLKGDLRLSNKGGCVYIFSGQNVVLDKFCYIKPKSGEKVFSSLPISDEYLINLRDISLYQSGDKFCVKFKGQKLFCKEINVSKISKYKKLKENYKALNAGYKNLQKEYRAYKRKVKKIAKLILSYIKKLNKSLQRCNKTNFRLYDKLAKYSEKLDKYKQKYEDLKEKYTNYRQKCRLSKEKLNESCDRRVEYYKDLYNKCKNQRTLYYQKYRLYKEFVQIIKSRIKDRWKPLWEKEGLPQVENNFSRAKSLIDSGVEIKDFKKFLIEGK